MQTAFVDSRGGAARENAPACPSFFAQVRALELAARERDSRRVERWEMAALAADVELCAMAAGEPRRLSCQKGNISRTGYVVKNQSYYHKAALALQVNIQRWAFELGRRYASSADIAVIDGADVSASIRRRLDVARNHVAEFTITIPHYASETPEAARRRFTAAWNDFNRRFLKERFAAFFGEYVRVFEPHKDGVLHCHCIIECRKSLRRADGAPFRWRQAFGRSLVDGRTVAPWVCDVWRAFRDGDVERVGIGRVHTLQPIRKGVSEFAKYISKYVSKGLGARPMFMRGLRAVAYSETFLGGVRAMPYEADKSRRIEYFSKKHNCKKWRYRRFAAFDIECPATSVRRLKMKRLCDWLKIKKEHLKRLPNWGFKTRAVIASTPLENGDIKNKWFRFADVRNWFGDKFSCVMKFADSPRLLSMTEFLETDIERRLQTEFEVVGFILGGAFRSMKEARQMVVHRLFARLKSLRGEISNECFGFQRVLDDFKKRLFAEFTSV